MKKSIFPYIQSFEIDDLLKVELNGSNLREHLIETVREELVDDLRSNGYIRTAWSVEDDEDCHRYIPVIAVNGDYLDVIFFDKVHYPGQEVGEIAQSIVAGYRPEMADTEMCPQKGLERKARLAGWLGLGWIEKGAV